MHGHQQAAGIAARIKRNYPAASAIYTSPLLCARLSAATIGAALQLEPCLRSGLQEMQVAALHDTAELATKDESPLDFVERIMGTLYGLVMVHRG